MENYLLSNSQFRGVSLFDNEKTMHWENFFGLSGACDETMPECCGNFYLDTEVGRFEGKSWKNRNIEAKTDKLSVRQEAGPFSMVQEWCVDEDSGVISWKGTLKNTDNVKHTVFSCLPRIPLQGGNYEAYAQFSSWCAENQGGWMPLTAGNLVLTNSAGRSTESATPFVCIRHKETGASAAIHIIPRGDWMIRLRRVAGHRLCYLVIEAGLSNESLRYQLEPDEKIDLPELLMYGFSMSIDNSCEPLQKYLLKRYSQNALPELVYNSWFLNFDYLELDELKRQANAALDVGCKTFVIDAGWFGAGTDWENQVGCWEESKDRAFFGKMKEFADYIRSIGLNFGLWMEPERACRGTAVYEEHPEWFLKADAIIFDLTKDDVISYLVGEVTRLVKTYGLSWMKLDYNTNMLRDLTGDNFYRYYLGERRLMSEIRSSNPTCSFEGCASGGLRTDFDNVLTNFHGHFVSDTVHPLEILRIRQNTAMRLLPAYMGSWLTPQETSFAVSTYFDHNRDARKKVLFAGDGWWDQTVDVSLDFALAVNQLGEWGISGNLYSLSEDNRSKIRAAADFYEKHRSFMAHTICHLLTEAKPLDDYTGWVAMQYENPQAEASLLFVFRLADDAQTLILYPKNLKPAQIYILSHDGITICKKSGAAFISSGIMVSCDRRYDAKIYELRSMEG